MLLQMDSPAVDRIIGADTFPVFNEPLGQQRLLNSARLRVIRVPRRHRECVPAVHSELAIDASPGNDAGQHSQRKLSAQRLILPLAGG